MAKKPTVQQINPTVRAAYTWNVFRTVPNSTLSINADSLVVTADGALSFTGPASGGESQIICVVGARQYEYAELVVYRLGGE